MTSSWANGLIKGSDSMAYLSEAIRNQHNARSRDGNMTSARPACAAKVPDTRREAEERPTSCLADFSFTFIGTNAGLRPSPCIHVIPAGTSEHVAATLASQDLYFAPSRKEPASNSLVEAIAVGLPVLFRDEGGHPEMVGFGGLPFTADEQILPRLGELVRDYATFAAAVGQPLHRDIDRIAQDYIDAFHGREPGFGAEILRAAPASPHQAA